MSGIKRTLAYAPIAIIVIGFVVAHRVPGWPLWTVMVPGIAMQYIVRDRVISVHRLTRGLWNGMRQTWPVVLILLLIAALMAVWQDAGVIAQMIGAGSHLLRPSWLLVLAFLLTAGVSLLLGTAIGAMSAVGALFIGAAHAAGIPAAWVAGAVLSGAMVGDRSSPVSGTVYLLAGMTRTRQQDNYRVTTPTLVISIGLTVMCEVLLQYVAHVGRATLSVPAISGHVQIAYLLLPLSLLVLAFLRVPIRVNLLLSIAVAAMLAVVGEHVPVAVMLMHIWFGSTLVLSSHQVLHAGGVWPTLDEMLLVLLASGLAGMLEAGGGLSVIGHDVRRVCRGIVSVSVSTVLVSIGSALLFSSQTLAIVMPAQIMQPICERFSMTRGDLVRLLSDSGVVFAPVIPWNLLGVLSAEALGVKTSLYAPFAVFCFLSPVVSILYSVIRARGSQRVSVH